MADTNGVKEEPKVEAETATEEVKQSTPDVDMQDEQEGAEMEDGEGEEAEAEAEAEDKDAPRPQVPQTTTKDRTLKEFLGMMDQYAPIIPDAVTDYYLGLAGFECEDPRIKRLLALAAQKFVADIAQDAYQYSKIRAAGSTTGGAALPAQPRGRYGKDRGRAVLTMDDLGSAVHEYGINLKRQDFMR